MSILQEKKGLMVQFPCARGRVFVCKNIGDYVQSVAARQFVDPIDEYIEQEEADQYFPEDKRKIKLIMNGWFQWRAENWPPSEYVHPLLISMHLSPLRAEQLLTEKGIEFLRKNGPVGCRDIYTKNLLETVGVPAYYSSCLTLTLGKKYRVDDSIRDKVYIVDPFFEIPELITESKAGKKKMNWKALLSGLGKFLKHPAAVCILAKSDFFKKYSPTGFIDRNTRFYRPFYKAALFYSVYIKKFDKRLLLNAEYITHWLDVDMKTGTNDQLLDIAESLVKKYASAKMVITSRIHCGLPALGLETPVVFIANQEVISENGSFNTPGRLGGLIDLFRILTLENGDFTTDDEVFHGISRFYEITNFKNKPDWKEYAEKLAEKCSDFMENDK